MPSLLIISPNPRASRGRYGQGSELVIEEGVELCHALVPRVVVDVAHVVEADRVDLDRLRETFCGEGGVGLVVDGVLRRRATS